MFLACQKIVQNRLVQNPSLTPTNSRPTTPQGGTRLGIASFHHSQQPSQNQTVPHSPTNGQSTGSHSPASALAIGSGLSPSHHLNYPGNNSTLPHRQHGLSASSHHIPVNNKPTSELDSLNLLSKCSTAHATSQSGLLALINDNNNLPKFLQYERTSSSSQPPPSSLENLQLLGLMPPKETLPTPTSTPTTSRKSRRRSNLFIPSSKKDDKLKNSDGQLGSGRAIPLKQGYLYKRSSKSLNKEWKKKYVTLCDDGRLTYHPSLHDYMDDVHGKEISLQYVTVKVPGQKPRGSKSIITNSALTKYQKNGINNNNNNTTINTTSSITESFGGLSLLKDKKSGDNKVLLTAFDSLREPGKASSQSGDESGIALSNSNSQSFVGSDSNNSKMETQTPNVKKRHRRMKSSGLKNNELEGKLLK